MGQRGEIYSTRHNARERTYFFNVHENIRNQYSLSINESKSSDTEGRYLRQSVLVYEEDFDSFLRELQKAVDVMKLQIKERESKTSAKPRIVIKKRKEDK